MTLREVTIADDAEADDSGYPFSLAAVRALPIAVDRGVTVFVGENGSGKSTLIEAIAVAAGFNPEGGSRNASFDTMDTHSELAQRIRLRWSARRLPLGWFLRAESLYNVATYRDQLPDHGLPPLPSYHERSHGESFLQVAADWFTSRSLVILDEPESALSFSGQLALVTAIAEGVAAGGQFLLATHSPILMSIPGATVYEIDDLGIHRRSPDDLEVMMLWRSFLESPDRFLRHLG